MTTTVLLVASNEHLRLLVSTTLEDEGYELLEARDGVAALAIARAERPAVVLLDVALPGLDSVAVCQTIKRDPALMGTRVVRLASMAELLDQQRGRAAGADADLTTPFSPLELLQVVNERTKRESDA